MDLDFDIAIPTETGEWVSANHERIARIIQDYDPELHLAWIPPGKRGPDDKPFAILHTPEGRASYIVFHSDTCDERILERLWRSDTTHHNVLTDLDAHNAAIEAIEKRKQLDEMEEANDLARSIYTSPLNTFKHGGVKYQ